MANPNTYPSDGRMTTLQNYTATLLGTELSELVAPGNASLGVNYNVTQSFLAQQYLNLAAGSGTPGDLLMSVQGKFPQFEYPPGGVSAVAFGATGNGTTDDTATIQAAINAVASTNGGTVFLPVTNATTTYLVRGVTLPRNTRLVGPGGVLLTPAVLITTGGVDTTAITLTGVNSAIEWLSIFGGGVGSANPTVQITMAASQSEVSHCEIAGGVNALLIQTADFRIYNNRARNAYGTAIVKVVSTSASVGGYFFRNTWNQGFVAGAPLPGALSSIAPWTATTGVAFGGILLVNGTALLQATTGGTTSGVSPVLPNYGSSVVDGSVTWQFLAPAVYYGVQYDTNAASCVEIMDDHSGPFTAGVALTNTAAGTPPGGIVIDDCLFGSNFTAGIYAGAGSALTVTNSRVSGSVFTTAPAVWLTSSFSGDVSLANNLLLTSAYGVRLSGGRNVAISGNNIFGSSIAAIGVDAGVSHFSVVGNQLGSSLVEGGNAIAVAIATGSSDFYNISNNNINGASIGVQDNGTGTHKLVGGNEAPFALTNLAPQANSTILGNNSGTTASPSALTASQVAGITEQGLTLLNVVTAAASTVLSDTASITAAYNDYLITFDNIIPSNGSANFNMLVQSNGTFQGSSYLNDAGGATAYFDFLAGAATLSTTAGFGLSTQLWLHNANSNNFKFLNAKDTLWYTTAGALNVANAGGLWTGGTTVITGIQCQMNTGTLSGVMKVYGLRSTL